MYLGWLIYIGVVFAIAAGYLLFLLFTGVADLVDEERES